MQKNCYDDDGSKNNTNTNNKYKQQQLMITTEVSGGSDLLLSGLGVTHLILTTTLQGLCIYDLSLLTNEETEARRRTLTVVGPVASRW